MDLLRTAVPYSSLLLRTLRRYGDRPAFSGHGGKFTYARAFDLVGRYQSVFAAAGLERGQRLALLSSNRGDAWLADVAAQAMGLCTTPLHPMSVVEDHRAVLEDGGIQTLVVDVDAYGEVGGELAARGDSLERAWTLGPASYGIDLLAAADAAGAATPRALATCEDEAWLSYTGGTTGRPKGALRTQSLMSSMANTVAGAFDWPSRTDFLAVAPISHVGGTKLAPTLMNGGRVHFHHGFDPQRILHDVAAEKITATLLAPTMIYLLLDTPGLDEADLSSLELLLYGASPMAPSRLVEGLERIGQVFSQLYGQTECYPISVLAPDDHDLARPERLTSCGFPVGATEVAILDAENQPVEDGEMGEICVRAPHMMDGYWLRPEENAEVFEGGWLHTGDVGRADERGYLYILDRKKDMIITGGFNVYPKEIEDLLSSHPSVARVAVIGVPDPKWGEAIKAIVVPREGASVDGNALIELVRARKGPVKAPKSIETVDEIPLTPVGKPDKKALQARSRP
jgi:fatty-acyl-CoA synthase